MNESNDRAAEWLKLSAPAKVNLMLSVHGRRADGFHELTSLVAPLQFGDTLELRVSDRETDTLVSEGSNVPLDDSNLVLQSARAFRRAFGRSETFDFRLKKHIPVGAGLGGGSSDAVAALKGMDALLGTGLSHDQLRGIAATLGSDCPFFVDARPARMCGRGEVIEPVDRSMAGRLNGQGLVLFRPDFGVDTGWAYKQLGASPEHYEAKALADSRLRVYEEGGNLSDLLHNGFEGIVGRKFLAIPCLLELLRARGYNCMMSGSGSACFGIVNNSEQAAEIRRICFDCWGESTFWVETSLTEQKMW